MCYVGETIDQSDLWLIQALKERFAVRVVTPTDSSPKLNCSFVINRLYGSAVSRHRNAVEKILNLLKGCEESMIPVVNSVFGYALEANRIKQYKLFLKAGLCYVPTVSVLDAKPLLFKTPYVLKNNSIFRNKELRIVRSLAQLENISEEIGEGSVLQSLIQGKVCYRTEFIGTSHLTFLQSINTTSHHLTFQYTGEIINTPLWETMGAMNYLVDKGMARFIGVSNFSLKRLTEAQSFSEHKIVLDQVHYNLVIREAEKGGLVSFCQKNDIILSAWRPLQKGTFLDNSSLLEEMSVKYHRRLLK